MNDNMMNYPIDEALDMAEAGAVNDELITIDLVRKASGKTKSGVAVYGTNTLQQLVDAYAGSLGIGSNAKITFTNKRTMQETSDPNMTIAQLGLQNGDVLALADDANVA